MTVLFVKSRERTRFFRFLVVGTIGAVVDFGIANLLIRVFGAPYVLSGAISFICAIFSNFIWNRLWTYPDSRSKPIIRQLIQFAIVSATGLVIRIPILRFLEPLITKLFLDLPENYLFLPPDALGQNATLAIAVIIVLFWNFFVNRYWTYSDVQ